MSKNKNILHAEIHLPVFKQGDDLGHLLTEAKQDIAQALKWSAEHYLTTANLVLQIENIFSTLSTKDKENVSIHADCHYIAIDGPKKFIQKLVDEKLAYFPEFDEVEE